MWVISPLIRGRMVPARSVPTRGYGDRGFNRPHQVGNWAPRTALLPSMMMLVVYIFFVSLFSHPISVSKKNLEIKKNGLSICETEKYSQ